MGEPQIYQNVDTPIADWEEIKNQGRNPDHRQILGPSPCLFEARAKKDWVQCLGCQSSCRPMDILAQDSEFVDSDRADAEEFRAWSKSAEIHRSQAERALCFRFWCLLRVREKGYPFWDLAYIRNCLPHLSVRLCIAYYNQSLKTYAGQAERALRFRSSTCTRKRTVALEPWRRLGATYLPHLSAGLSSQSQKPLLGLLHPMPLYGPHDSPWTSGASTKRTRKSIKSMKAKHKTSYNRLVSSSFWVVVLCQCISHYTWFLQCFLILKVDSL